MQLKSDYKFSRSVVNCEEDPEGIHRSSALRVKSVFLKEVEYWYHTEFKVNPHSIWTSITWIKVSRPGDGWQKCRALHRAAPHRQHNNAIGCVSLSHEIGTARCDTTAPRPTHASEPMLVSPDPALVQQIILMCDWFIECNWKFLHFWTSLWVRPVLRAGASWSPYMRRARAPHTDILKWLRSGLSARRRLYISMYVKFISCLISRARRHFQSS